MTTINNRTVTHACTCEIYASVFFSPSPAPSLSSSHTRQVRAGKAWTGCCICMHRLIWMHRCILNGPAAIWSHFPFGCERSPARSSLRSRRSRAAFHARKRTARISNYRSFPRSLTPPLLSPARGVYERLPNESFGSGITIIVQQVRRPTLKESRFTLQMYIPTSRNYGNFFAHCTMCYNLKLFKKIIWLCLINNW